MGRGTTIVDRLNKLSGKDATTIAKALENLEEGGGIGGFEIHICASGEYDAETKVPIIENPDSSTLYLVPTSSKRKNKFDEYVWTGTDWEKFGTGSVALPSPTTSDNGKVLGVDGGEYKLVEQSSGAEVSKIKIATANGAVSSLHDNLQFFSGGASILDGASIADLIGDKTIVDFACNINLTYPAGESFAAVFKGILGNAGDIRLKTPAELAEIKGLTVQGWTTAKSNPSSATVDIYAICIKVEKEVKIKIRVDQYGKP